MASANDVAMTDGAEKRLYPNDYADLLQTPYSDAFAFSDVEQLALELHDQLRELELEKSLIEAHDQDDVLHEHLITAEREAMEVKAKFEIRNRISHNVLVMDPVLKAVHGGQQHTAEKRMLPLITENDAVSMLHGLLASRLSSTTRALSTAEQATIAANKDNRELSGAVVDLAEKLKAQSINDIGDPSLHQQVERADKKVKQSRQRAKILKGILSAMIVGSGINWAADEELRELVMDDEEDG
ncbi:hypothetical protein BU23DRAFT_449638 [Bimuria novae-zelandiae CBS 107.79]|uniref:Centromere protein H C-terminal domain-containing protein n=1 Tax=Bimuria novae-zelandiae CBS 107.79 TaxID=1447943 RepID=A0A6A5VKW8_9PLEO|nr:hypothetical protein BU23DRAFT_449638 [Bimuria novae-zelandiae CBS 107.79]